MDLYDFYDELTGEILSISLEKYNKQVRLLYGNTTNSGFKLTDEIDLYNKKRSVYSILTNEEKKVIDKYFHSIFQPQYLILKIPTFEDNTYNKTYFELAECIYPLAMYDYNRSIKIYNYIISLIKPNIDDILFYLDTLIFKLFDNKNDSAAINYSLLLFETAKENPIKAKKYYKTFTKLCNKIKDINLNNAIDIAEFCLNNNYQDTTKTGWKGRLEKLNKLKAKQIKALPKK